MSVSRRQIDQLRSAGWTVAEYGPWPAVKRTLARCFRRPSVPVAHLPRRGWSR